MVHRGLTNQVHPLTLWQPQLGPSKSVAAVQWVWLHVALRGGRYQMNIWLNIREQQMSNEISRSNISKWTNKGLGRRTWKTCKHVARRVYMHARAQRQPPGQHTHEHTPPQALRARAVHLDVINQCDWIAGVRLGLELQRKGPFRGWTDPNSLWQGGY